MTAKLQEILIPWRKDLKSYKHDDSTFLDKKADISCALGNLNKKVFLSDIDVQILYYGLSAFEAYCSVQ